MKRFSIYKVIITWLLVVIFIFPHVVKSTHIFQCKHVCQNIECQTKENSQDENKHHHPVHDCTTCLICKFTLPHFTETELSGKIEIPQTQNIRILIGYNEDVYIPLFTSHYLRAPPFS